MKLIASPYYFLGSTPCPAELLNLLRCFCMSPIFFLASDGLPSSIAEVPLLSYPYPFLARGQNKSVMVFLVWLFLFEAQI
jgi:hypothetical protein